MKGRISLKKTHILINALIYAGLILLAFATLFPFINSMAISLNRAYDTAQGGIYFWPRVFTLENYRIIFKYPDLYSAFVVTIARTVLGTALGLLCTGMFAYGLSKSNLKGKNVYMGLTIFTMYFGGGLIPYYLLLKSMFLIDKFAVLVLPYLINVFNMIIMRTYFKSLPEALEESAKIDGAGLFSIFFRIIVPISGPILATMALFIGVFHWNSWFDANLFIFKDELRPLQMILIRIINSTRIDGALASAGATDLSLQKIVNVRSVTASTMMVTVIPIIMVYPFLQKYFVKGIMIGAVKG